MNRFFVSLLVVLIAAVPVVAATVRGMVAEGNQAYQAEKYDEAVSAYDAALTKDPTGAVARFNRGAALYRQQDYHGALEAWQQALDGADPGLRTKILYNLGNGAFMKGEQAATAEPQKAMEQFQNGSRYYRQALEGDPSDLAAGRNLEISRQRIKALRELLANQPQQPHDQGDQQQEGDNNQQGQGQQGQGDNKQPGQDQSNQNDQQQLKDLIDRQRQAADQNNADPQGDKERQTRTEEQKNLNTETGQFADQAESKSDAMRRHLDQAQEKQQDAVDKMKDGKFQEAREDQQQAADELSKALAAAQNNDSPGEKENQEAGSEEKQPEQETSEQDQGEAQGQEQAGQPSDETPPPDQTAHQILNQEKSDRQERQLRGIIGYQAVEKDW
ncbi:MAG: tetratricopeptide repeat protein [Proteobacteria bacterium]|nr:tetratricopeptide repeat protein [Pseudomonadota bacterium]MBU1688133.1 tetratricopeptide repeat protein [Pseudomonadota bacterium]